MIESSSEKRAGGPQVMLLRLVETADTGQVAMQCWTGHVWRPVAIDGEFSRAFAASDASPEVSPVGTAVTAANDDDAIPLEFAAGARAIILLPGSWVWSGLESIPRAARKQSAAVGYMVEERLAEDVEELHFICQPRAGNLCSVYAIQHRKMTALSGQLERLGWPVIAAVPEYQLLDLFETDVSLWLDGDRAHIWRRAGYGLTVRRRYLQPLLASLTENDADLAVETSSTEVQSPPELSLLGAGEQDGLTVAELESLFGDGLRRVEAEAENQLLTRLRIPALANLLVGDYRPAGEAGDANWWLGPLKVATACFVLQLVLFVAAGGYYSWQAQRHDAQARALFTELFPNARAGADIRRQIQGYLNQAGGGGGGFASQVSALSRAWEQHRGEQLKLQSLRFDGNRGEMVIQLQAATLSELDGFVGRLSSGQYTAELLAANELESGVSGRIRLR
ncbi:type II secretion system protein GspL [Microbulbifer sediminum]|uniref:type II secretion system protein GspL n=1 Tax=Microbulbifer sediminum TaxID=2904250 RepID=UPI001F007887|nr:type II secretion system protein GspL [Microbulbifer sediminum]